MVLTPIPWAARVWALPFLTILAPSERFHADRGHRHKRLTNWARQGVLCVCRWLPGRQLIFVGDSSFAAIEFVTAIARRATMISRLRLDANLFAPPPEHNPHRPGRPALKGKALPKLKAVLTDPATDWRTVLVTGWYGGQTRRLHLATGVALWYRSGVPPLTLRWVLVRDPARPDDPQAFFCTDTDFTPETILAIFVRRWAVEVTFQECRAHLGVETQRQWSDLAILRTTPALLGMHSLITLWATVLIDGETAPRRAAWYPKSRLTFSDAIALLRYRLWLPDNFENSTHDATIGKFPIDLVRRMAEAIRYAA